MAEAPSTSSRSEALFALFRQFLKRISLPRLIHFLDLVLPQLMPVQGAWAKRRLYGAAITLKVLGRGWRFHDFFGAQTGARKEGFLHVALTTLFNKSLPWHALGPCIH